VVTNAMLYGGDPVRARAWALDEGVVVVVDDGGHGVDDPYAGLLPSLRDDGEGGYGLWMAHQLCREVQLERRPGGFRVRLLAGAA